MNCIFGTLAEVEGSPVMISVSSISMIAGSIEGGCTIFFSEPQSRITVTQSYEEIYQQVLELKKLIGDEDIDFFQKSGGVSLNME